MNQHRASVDFISTKGSSALLESINNSVINRRVSSVDTFSYKNSNMAQKYEIVERGTLHTLDYRIFIKGPNGYISPWHDIPLYADKEKSIFNMIVEIPRWSNAKMEIATTTPLTPIKQDKKNEKPRFVHNVFPHRGYIWNYGAFPQTWEDPEHEDENTKVKGDNDPIDVIEIGSKIYPSGSVIQVKVLGILGLLDDGETDWKVVTISVADPLANQLNSIVDVDKYLKGLTSATHEWFRIYKIPTGKPPNVFAFNGAFKDVGFALKIIEGTHKAWKKLITNPNPPLNTVCHVEGAAFKANNSEMKSVVDSFPPLFAPQPVPDDFNKFVFLQ